MQNISSPLPSPNQQNLLLPVPPRQLFGIMGNSSDLEPDHVRNPKFCTCDWPVIGNDMFRAI